MAVREGPAEGGQKRRRITHIRLVRLNTEFSFAEEGYVFIEDVCCVVRRG